MTGIKEGYPAITKKGIYIIDEINSMKAREWILRSMKCGIMDEPTESVYTNIKDEETRQRVSEAIGLPLEYTEEEFTTDIYTAIEDTVKFMKIHVL